VCGPRLFISPLSPPLLPAISYRSCKGFGPDCWLAGGAAQVLETQIVNSVVPFILASQLRPLMLEAVRMQRLANRLAWEHHCAKHPEASAGRGRGKRGAILAKSPPSSNDSRHRMGSSRCCCSWVSTAVPAISSHRLVIPHE